MAGLLDIKNKMEPLKKKNGVTHSTNVLQLLTALLIGAILVIAVTSCKPRKVVIEKESVYKETFRDTTIHLPGEVVYKDLSDSFLNVLKSRFKNNLKDTVRIPSLGGKAELQFYVDQFGQLQAACEAKDREIDALIKVIEKFESYKKEEAKTITRVPVWAWWCLGIVICVTVINVREFLK
jgi:hypothetical protein